MKILRRLFRALAILVLCRWLHIHWLTEHHEYANDDGRIFVDKWCDLCLYWPGIDDPDDYDYFEVLK